MTKDRKTADARENDLRLAMHRITKGRARTKESAMSISSVAREAGVSAALIHNHYPKIADAIRQAQGRDARRQRDAKQEQLKLEEAKSRGLRQQIESLRLDRDRLASINEVLLAENASLRAQLKDLRVIPLRSK